jgi:hypothetical protein
MKQNLTIQLDKETIRKAKLLAARNGTSIGRLVAAEIRRIVREDDDYESAQRMALALLDQGFHLGGIRVSREELHDRQSLRRH